MGVTKWFVRLNLRPLIAGALLLVASGGDTTATDEAAQNVNLRDCVDWEIVVDANAIPSEHYAAKEFQAHFRRATDASLPITDQASDRNGQIFIGDGTALQAALPDFKVEQLPPEDFRIQINERAIAIAGGRPRGTLYGVYTFLEDYLGIRFLTYDHTHVPRLDKARLVAPIDRTYHPPLAFRWSYYGENMAHPPFATKRRVNTVSDELQFGGRTGRRLISHSFGHQISSADFGKEHPEYFSERDGIRLASVSDDFRDNEPCLSNPAVRKIVTASVLAELRANPTVENVSVSQNDNDKYCRCTRCAAIDEREGTPMGSLLEFVNSVAEDIEPEFPKVKVGTLSYWYTRRPPTTLRPRHNVQIQLCSIECCLIHPIDDPSCELNVQFCSDMKRWSALCDDIGIWNYNTNFSNYLLPCPNLRVIEPNVRYFVKNQAHGIFMQAAGNAMGAELSDLRNYLISGLLWDPSHNGDQLIEEFLTLHYAESAPPIRAFIKQVHDTAERSGRHKNCFGHAGQYGIDDSLARAGLEAFATATQLAMSDEVRQRVAKASICAYRAAVEPVWYMNDAHDLGDEQIMQMRPLLRQLFALCEQHGVTQVSEYESVSAAKGRLQKSLGLADGESF